MALGVWCIRIRHKVSRSKDPPRRGGGGTGLKFQVQADTDPAGLQLSNSGGHTGNVEAIHVIRYDPTPSLLPILEP